MDQNRSESDANSDSTLQSSIRKQRNRELARQANERRRNRVLTRKVELLYTLRTITNLEQSIAELQVENNSLRDLLIESESQDPEM